MPSASEGKRLVLRIHKENRQRKRLAHAEFEADLVAGGAYAGHGGTGARP